MPPRRETRRAIRNSRRGRRLRRAVVVYFAVVFWCLIWPVYPYFSRIKPLVLGLPFSLFYLVAVLLCSFLVMLGLYLWEARHGELD